ncbi:MAG: ArsR/SmtB family transcription factor [Gaiellaceae bacterium]
MDSSRPPLAILSALASERRCEIVRLLRVRPRSVLALCDRTGLSQPAVSKHLRVLRDAGLVDWTEVPGDRRMRIYRIRKSALFELEDWLATLAPARGRDPRPAPDAAEDLRGLRDTPYTTRGTPRIRRRFYWRKKDAEAAASGDPRWLEKEVIRATKERRAVLARQYRLRGQD